MKFSELIKIIGGKVINFKDFEIAGVSSDSRVIKKGDIFVGLAGSAGDGFDFIREAVLRGAAALVYEKSKSLDKNIDIPAVAVDCPRKTLSRLAALIYKIPAPLEVIAITGTNGKTTTAYLIEHIFKNQKIEIGTIGTINYRFKDRKYASFNTTPEPVALFKLLGEMAEENVKFAVLEVSSHALKQFRADNINFKYAVFTNLSAEHLDYHNTVEDYFCAKVRLFTELKPSACSIINMDDKFSRRLMTMCQSRVLTFGFDKKADIKAENISGGLDGMKFDLVIKDRKISAETKLIARYNVYNMLAAAAAAYLEGLDLEMTVKSLSAFEGVPGRLQRIDCGQPFFIFIDYAHTPDALEKVLVSLRGFVEKKIITVFGCGGNRDRIKRPLMGAIAAALSDTVILTDDNPRWENSLSIINEIKTGIKDVKKLEVIPDRKHAIEAALNLAEEGDCVLIAGKGHEDCQIIGNEKIKFNDLKTVKELLLPTYKS